jgi:hypothetical protein
MLLLQTMKIYTPILRYISPFGWQYTFFFELLTVGKAPTAFVLDHLLKGVNMGSYMGRNLQGGQGYGLQII